MAAFAYRDCPYPLRDELIAAHRRAWQTLAGPGNWWRGDQRVALLQALRDAPFCPLCIDRGQALNPFAVHGSHSVSPGARVLPAAAVEAVHRLVTDPARLTSDWLDGLRSSAFSDGHYVELVGVVVAGLSIDTLHRALGIPPEPLPEPVAGEPDGYRPPGAAVDVGWVPMLRPETLSDRERDIFFAAPRTANVIRALSLVPDAVRLLHDLAAVHYLPTPQVADMSSTGTLSLTRPQIELLAARTSALNDCFY